MPLDRYIGSHIDLHLTDVYVGQHIGWHSIDMSTKIYHQQTTNILLTINGQRISRVSAAISTEISAYSRSLCRPWLSLYHGWYISRYVNQHISVVISAESIGRGVCKIHMIHYFYLFVIEKQFDVRVSCVCPAIDSGFHHNIVKLVSRCTLPLSNGATVTLKKLLQNS